MSNKVIGGTDALRWRSGRLHHDLLSVAASKAMAIGFSVDLDQNGKP